jgi:hypothetical protein
MTEEERQQLSTPGYTSAPSFLNEAVRQMEARAALRDTPGGERTVGTITAMFNILTGHNLSEPDGWKFLLLLKLVRAENGGYHADDYVDLSAYGALLGESESRLERDQVANNL